MAGKALRERLQPALLDRLRDEERAVPVLELSVSTTRLEQLGVTLGSLIERLRAQGCRPLDAAADAGRAESGSAAREVAGEMTDAAAGEAGARCLLFSVPPADLALARLRSLPLQPPSGSPLTLADCARLELRSVRNPAREAPEQRLLSMRRLREAVLRDLVWLLNTTNLETHEDLSRHPEVACSVLNFGMRSLAGRTASSVDPQQAARRIGETIRVFEPRLSHVTVVPELSEERMDQRTLSFRIEAQLWGQPAPQQLLLRTHLDVESGDLSIREAS